MQDSYFDYHCDKCKMGWLLLKNIYNPQPQGRKPGQCYCGCPFPKTEERK